MHCNLNKLLILTARPAMTEAQAERLRSICDSGVDWPLFAKRAERAFSLPFALRNLQSAAGDLLPEPTASQMRGAALAMTMATMRLAAAQKDFQRICLEGLGVRYCYIKGIALGALYYGNFGLRFARDIDVLIHPEDMPDVIRRALMNGYMLANGTDITAQSTSWHIKELLGKQDTLSIYSPEGALIELHHQLGKDGFDYFDTSELIGRKVSFSFDGQSSSILAPDDLFCYLCYHHTGHYWSRLHWLADLDAIMRHTDFDLTTVRTRSKDFHLEATVAACVELNRLSSDVDDWPEDRKESHGAELLSVCLKNAVEFPEFEFKMREAIYPGWFAFKWQQQQGRSLHFLTNKAKRLVAEVQLQSKMNGSGSLVALCDASNRILKYVARASKRTS